MVRVLLFFFFIFTLVEAAKAEFLPKAFEVKLTQVKKTEMGRERKEKVALKYQFPSQLNMNVVTPDQETSYICNRSKAWMYQPPFMEGEKGTVSISNSSASCYSKLFDAFNQGLKDNELYKVKKLADNSYDLIFSKGMAEQLKYIKANLSFKTKKTQFENIKAIKLFTEDQKKPDLLNVDNFEVVKGFKKTTFEFVIPPNTNIQK